MRELFEQLEMIESTSGSKKKKELLATLVKNKDHKEIIRKALDPRFPMYLGREAKFEPVDADTDPHDAKSFNVVMQSLHDELIPRGHRANEAVGEVIFSLLPKGGNMRSLHIHEVHMKAWSAKWISRLVTKDLQIGVSWKTFTDVTKEKKFSVMLAKDINKIKKLEEKFEFPVFVQPKLDGYRAIANTSFGGFELKSRNGKEYKNFPQIVEALKECCPEALILDGEIMSDDFQAMQKTAFRQDEKQAGDVYFAVFDVIHIDEWEKQEGHYDMDQRMTALGRLNEKFHPFIGMVPTYECHSWEEVYEYHAQFLNQGYEGTMVRANEFYQFKRTDFLAKIKEMQSMDCKVIGIEEGRNSLKDSMGHLIVRQENGHECGVGSGFSIDCRKEIWDNEDLYIGRIVEIKYQELTKDGIMRFPVFLRWRDDK